MQGRGLATTFFAVLLATTACGADDDTGDEGAPAGDLLEALQAIPGMMAVEEPVDSDLHRFFRLEYEQPVDHGDPDGPRFVQRMTLLHIDRNAPLVLHTTGYHLIEQPFRAEVTELLDSNQLHVEQRFFAPSRPDPADWSKLRIAQAAADHHRITLAISPLYPGAWLSTGASKGGMTSIYHRRFYPDDVDGTVAYVAPLSFGAPDDRYAPFFDSGGDAGCQGALEDMQRELLERRGAMLERMSLFAETGGHSFERAGGQGAAFEDSVLELSWGFWQYYGVEVCELLPDTSAVDDELWEMHVALGALDYYSDADIEAFLPYYYQTEVELGYPGLVDDHLAELLETQELERDYLPAGVTVTYDPGAMEDIDSWVQSEGERLLFIYGEHDPWTGGAFELGGAEDSYRLTAPGRNHGAGIRDLVAADQEIALGALERWTGVSIEASGRARAALRDRLAEEPPPPRGRMLPRPRARAGR
jgi:hypothetical protein